ncbi:hypothetical protein CDAR_412131 [Caerostris darwini]|uniref:Uncharacterized protein n=1 Tax=Caerostris darwini TaxID=1538125 RepID=A0AAV4WF03_9ARAC|nr:hypothetical protein CDAR_412131 [Caerostris darwini]
MVKQPPPPSLRGWVEKEKRTRKYRCELIENIHFPWQFTPPLPPPRRREWGISGNMTGDTFHLKTFARRPVRRSFSPSLSQKSGLVPT